MSAPEFPRPQAGDEFVVFHRKTRYREEQVIPVRVKAMARFRITLEGPEGEDLPWMYQEFDVRTQRVWGAYKDDRPTSHGGYELHTAETLKWADRERGREVSVREPAASVGPERFPAQGPRRRPDRLRQRTAAVRGTGGDLMAKERPLGENQRQALKALAEHNGGAWYPGAGWIWTNTSTTVRLLDSLVTRGLVSYSEEVSHRTQQPYPKYTITQAGRDRL